MNDSSGEDLPEEILEAAQTATLSLLPKKSLHIYEKEYECFKKWCSAKKVKKRPICEEVVLAYISEKSERLKSSSLWSKYSMLKSTLSVKEGIDISKYMKLKAYLKMKSSGYKAKKANVFTRQEVNTFIIEADDEKYLVMKVVLIIGLCGACRGDELSKITIDNVEDIGSLLIVNIPYTKTKIERTFTIPDKKENGINCADICKKYISLRPSHVDHRRFVLQYRSGKCTVQPIGTNQFSKIPRLIAMYLKLPNEEMYTGHSFRRTSASLLVGAGADILRLKRHGGWKSSTVAEGYLEESVEEKVQIANQILGGKKEEICPAIETNELPVVVDCNLLGSSQSSSDCFSGVVFNNLNNCTIHINYEGKPE